MKNKLDLLVTRIRLLVADNEAQDMVEYALLAGFVAVAAGALLPGISSSISTIFSKMGSVLTAASGS
jgi:pilus assembly protein Flp/PilA